MGSGTLFCYSSGGERRRIDSSGNGGIAIAPQSFEKLQVKTATDRNVAVFDNAAGTTIGGITDAGASASLRIAGQNLIFTGNGGSGAEHMRIDSSGNVMVGTTSTIDGARITSVASGSVSLGLNGSGGAAMIVRHPAANQIDFTTTATNSFFTFSSNTVERMRIDASGNVGIGTSSPSAKLQVVGNVMAGNGTAATPAYHFVGSSAIGMFTPDAGFSVAFSTASTERMRIDSTGVLTSKSHVITGIDNNAFEVKTNHSGNPSAMRIAGSGSINGITGSFQNFFVLNVMKDSGAQNSIYAAGNIKSDGNLSLPSGGVVFGATGGAVTSKTLDDYEEGIWYPVLKAASTNPTYTANNAVGYYVKIGNMVYVTWYSSVLNITNSGSGGAQIGNLPFTAASATQEYWFFNYQHGTGIAGTNTSGGFVERNNNNLIFIQQGTVTNSTWAQLNGRYVMVSAAYRTT